MPVPGNRAPAGAPRLRALADPRDPLRWHPRLLWWAVLDGAYLAEARRGPGRDVLLLVFDTASLDVPLARWHPGPASGGRLLADPDDVRGWKLLVESWADGRSGPQKPLRRRRGAARAPR
jgi:hypothetical protein